MKVVKYDFDVSGQTVRHHPPAKFPSGRVPHNPETLPHFPIHNTKTTTSSALPCASRPCQILLIVMAHVSLAQDDIKALEQTRQRLFQLTSNIASLKQDILQSNPLPQWFVTIVFYHSNSFASEPSLLVD